MEHVIGEIKANNSIEKKRESKRKVIEERKRIIILKRREKVKERSSKRKRIIILKRREKEKERSSKRRKTERRRKSRMTASP